MSRKIEVKQYTGGNERLDALRKEHFADENLWIINGLYGRFPVSAATREEALENYERLYKDRPRATPAGGSKDKD